ncbi:DUF2127 domain-containing protein [Hypericibacter sp.]|uniref:DUF2127 domain-containing protein n=1 Tax=Hypericibacter sp. TaxID=2705401 RepID=UPI003D6D8004
MNERRIRQIFEISLLLKGAHALIECIGGVALYLVSMNSIVALVNMITQEELIEDPNDFVATHLLSAAQNFSVGSKEFYAFYLLSHGAIKILLVIGLLRNRLWAYPGSLVALGLFVLYQLYRFAYTQAFGLILLTIFDLFLMVLIWHEYKLVRHRSPAP